MADAAATVLWKYDHAVLTDYLNTISAVASFLTPPPSARLGLTKPPRGGLMSPG